MSLRARARFLDLPKEPRHTHREDTAIQTETMKLRELTIRYSVKKNQDGHPIVVGRTIRHPSECAPALATLLQDEPSEVFGMLCLTTKHRVIAYHEVGRGHSRLEIALLVAVSDVAWRACW